MVVERTLGMLLVRLVEMHCIFILLKKLIQYQSMYYVWYLKYDSFPYVSYVSAIELQILFILCFQYIYVILFVNVWQFIRRDYNNQP